MESNCGKSGISLSTLSDAGRRVSELPVEFVLNWFRSITFENVLKVRAGDIDLFDLNQVSHIREVRAIRPLSAFHAG